jgi:hypothetical protein
MATGRARITVVLCNISDELPDRRVSGSLSVAMNPGAMAQRPCLSELSPAELLTRAHEYRCMAATASTPDTRDALNTLAIRYALLAAEREVSQQQGGTEEGRAC